MLNGGLLMNIWSMRRMRKTLTKGGSLGAFDDEGVVALLDGWGQGVVEYEAVGAQLLGHGAAVTVEVLVTLDVVGIVPIVDRALELGGRSSCTLREEGENVEQW